MSMFAQTSSARAGMIACVCAPSGSDDAAGLASIVAKLCIGFGLSVLSQALMFAVLPLAAGIVAPSPAMVGLPFAAMLFGAALATMPAAFLVDSFGRRAAFVLGATLAIGGAALFAFAVNGRLFLALCVSGFWFGVGQGILQFYRHAAALGAAGRGGASVLVFASGGVAALFAPLLLKLCEAWGGPFAPAYAATCAAAVLVVSLPVSLSLPHERPMQIETAPFAWRAIAPPTLAGGLAWFVMAHLMAAGPRLLADCGDSLPMIGGVVSLHLLAMFAPAALVIRAPAAISDGVIMLAGLACLGAGFWLSLGGESGLVASAMLVGGAGWSLVNAGALRTLHAQAQPSRIALALHDGLVLLAALGGAALV